MIILYILIFVIIVNIFLSKFWFLIENFFWVKIVNVVKWYKNVIFWFLEVIKIIFNLYCVSIWNFILCKYLEFLLFFFFMFYNWILSMVLIESIWLMYNCLWILVKFVFIIKFNDVIVYFGDELYIEVVVNNVEVVLWFY